MRKTLTSVVALSFALGVPAVAQDAAGNAEHTERLEAAGFESPRIVSGAEVARVTDDEGNTFYVVGGLGGMSGMDHGMDRAGMTGGSQVGGASGGDMTAGADGAAAGGAGAGGQMDVAGAGTTGAEEPGGAQSEQAIEAQAGQTETAEIGVGGQVPDPNIDMAGREDLENEPVEGGMAGAEGNDDALETADLGGSATMGGGLEEQLSAAGFDEYELLSDASVAEVTMGEGGQTIHVILGIDDADGGS